MSKKISPKLWVMKKLSKMASQLDKEGKYKAAKLVDDTIVKISGFDDGFDDVDGFDDFDEDKEEDFSSPFEQGGRFESGGLDAEVVELGSDEEALGGDHMISYLIAFVDGVAAGMFEDIDEVIAEARNVSEAFHGLMDSSSDFDDYDDPKPTEPKGKGQVLEFPGNR